MKKYISTKAIIGLLLLILLSPVVFFKLATSYSTPNNVTYVAAMPSEVKYPSYNSLYVYKEDYTVFIENQKQLVPFTGIMQFVSAHQKELQAKPLVIFVAADAPNKSIIEALDALVVNELKEYQMVAEK